jgi:hypothetical protein
LSRSQPPTRIDFSAPRTARRALALLLLINLLNFIDRQILAAVVGPLKASLLGDVGTGVGPALSAGLRWIERLLGFKPEDALIGLLGTAFLVTYTIGLQCSRAWPNASHDGC